MSLLLESIKLLDGKFYNLPYHEERMQRALRTLFRYADRVNLGRLLGKEDYPRAGCHKCRIVFDANSFDVSFSPYQTREIRRIRVVRDNDISYEFKFEDRREIDRLFSMRGDCDDVLITKNGLVTDCTYSNVVFRRGGQWFTPDSPLLEGTARARLIREKKIVAREIPEGDIRSFDSLKIINAMLEFDGPEIDVSDIVF